MWSHHHNHLNNDDDDADDYREDDDHNLGYCWPFESAWFVTSSPLPQKSSYNLLNSISNLITFHIFRVAGPLCGEFTGEFPSQRSVTRSVDVFFDVRPNKGLSKSTGTLVSWDANALIMTSLLCSMAWEGVVQYVDRLIQVIYSIVTITVTCEQKWKIDILMNYDISSNVNFPKVHKG